MRNLDRELHQVSNRLVTGHLSHPVIEGAFHLSYYEDCQHPTSASVKHERTVITNELAHGLNCWFLSRYLYDVMPSTSHLNLKG